MCTFYIYTHTLVSVVSTYIGQCFKLCYKRWCWFCLREDLIVMKTKNKPPITQINLDKKGICKEIN